MPNCQTFFFLRGWNLLKPRLARLLQRSAAVALPEGAGAPRSGGLESWKGSIMVFWIEKKTTKWIQLQNQIPIFWPFSWNYLCVASTTFLGRLGETSVSPMSCQDTEGTRPESPWFRTWQSGHPRTGRFVENWKLEGDPQVFCEIYLGIWW